MPGRTGSLAVPARRWWAAQAASGGHAAPARLPCTCMGCRRPSSCSSPPKLGSHRPGAREVAARAGVASKVALARNGPGARLIPCAGHTSPSAPTSRARRAGAARRSRRVRQTPVHVHGGVAGAASKVPPARNRRRSRAQARRSRRCSWSSPPPARRVAPARRRAVPARTAAASKVALARSRCGNGSSCAHASLPTKVAPPVKRRFESSFARRLLPLSAARAYAPNAPSGPSAGGQAATPSLPGSRARA
jgi:hypothetical protein